jgi:CheY-like chemotaxis protein
MMWSRNLSTARWTGRDGLFGACLAWIGGFSAEARLEGEHLGEREVRRIRAQQIDAVSRLTPITMVVNLVTVAIVLGVLWDTGSNGFLTVWALAVLSAALLAARAWLRARRSKPKEASARATRRMVVQAFLLAAIWGSLPIAVLSGQEPMNQMIIACLMAGMIAEDDATNRLVVTKMLREFDVETRMVPDGLQAMQAAAENDYDLVLMDVRMPEMDGLAATRAIRSGGARLEALPIIALTANAFPDDVKQCRDSGMSDFLAKPLRKFAMVAAILRAIGRADAPAAATSAMVA